jgi:hypothetical protein
LDPLAEIFRNIQDVVTGFDALAALDVLADHYDGA